MFNGIIEAKGKVQHLKSLKQGGFQMRLTAPPSFQKDCKAGASIAVNGACLTVVDWQQNQFLADISTETIEKTTFSNLKVGDELNLERAMLVSDRLNGHWVTGHIDGVTEILKIEPLEEFTKMVFKLPKEGRQYVVQKGSIAIEGISLTVNQCLDHSFDVMLIPETLLRTTLGTKKVGDGVQFEFDILGKYVEAGLKKNNG